MNISELTSQLKPLTKRQQEIFDYILECMAANGAPPTRVEIADHFGFRSPNAAEDHLKALDKKGHIELRSGTSRGIFITEQARAGMHQDSDIPGVIPLHHSNDNLSNVAVIGDVAAGAPIFAQEHVQQYISVDFERDLLAIRKADRANENEIVVARIEDDVTVKRYQRHGTTVSLIAENDDYDPIEVDLQTQAFAIEGVVVGLIRQGF